MDFVQGMLPSYLKHILSLQQPPNNASDYYAYFSRFLPPSVATTVISIISNTFGVIKTLQSHLSPLILRIVKEPDVASILVFLAILFISLKILDMAYRAVMFWVKLVFRLVLWGSIAAIGLWMFNRGIDGFVADVQELAEVFMGRYQELTNEAQQWKQHEEHRLRQKADPYSHRGRRGRQGWR